MDLTVDSNRDLGDHLFTYLLMKVCYQLGGEMEDVEVLPDAVNEELQRLKKQNASDLLHVGEILKGGFYHRSLLYKGHFVSHCFPYFALFLTSHHHRDQGLKAATAIVFL